MFIAYFIFSTSPAPFGCLEQGWGTHTLNFPRQGVWGREQGFSASFSEPSPAYSHLQLLYSCPRQS